MTAIRNSPEMTCGAPSWLCIEFLQEALLRGNSISQAINITTFGIAPATAPGDNYISELYRVLVKTNDGKQRSVIVKCLPTAEYNLKFICDARLFEKEILFYSETLGAMYAFDKTISLAPECLHVRPDSVLILEDLVPRGFKVSDRRVGLDLQHCVLCVRALAHLHALSTCLAPADLAARYKDTVYSGAGRAHAANYVANSVVSLASTVEQWPNYERFATKLRHIAPTSNDRVLELFAKESRLRVLNHGDFWTNNIMFRYSEDGEVVEIKMLDFQMLRYVSPALDLLYFIYTSPQEDVRINHQDTLLMEYHSEFCRSSRRQNRAPSLTLTQLKEEMETNAFFGFINACMMLPVVLADPKLAPDLGHVAKQDTRMDCHSESDFRLQFQRILLHFEDKGII